jgi:raffinose/stachyose/melibiose transport system substrate-binding protein
MIKNRPVSACLALAACLFPAVAFGAPPTFTFWHIGVAASDRAFFDGVVAAYEKSHPEIKIETAILENEAFKSKLATVMQAGTPPDIFMSWGGGTMATYAKAGLLKDITKEVKGTVWGNSMASGVWEVYSSGGRVYGAPFDMGGKTFGYNKELLAKVGYKDFPTDWDGFLSLVKKLKAASITPIALGGGDKWPGMYYFAYLSLRLGGGQLLQDTFSGKNGSGFNDPTFVKAGQMLAELAALKPFQAGFLGASFPDQGALMGNGDAAMELMGQWAPSIEKDYSATKQGLGDKLGCAPFPSVRGGKGLPTEIMGGGNGMAVGRDAPPAAIDFLKFLTSKENNISYARTASIIPTVRGAEVGLVDPNARFVKAIVDKCSFFQLYLDQFLSPSAGGALNDAVQSIIALSATPARACAAIQAAYVASE